ncbi:NAD(P)/FAD-dependent oxidoreductase [Dokdonella sp.]|uniref:NAD(P)/FAD-dependent oxidoreductase n=1 Tax=Dokdonella sp. TaxID=2291710 RepID=UPI003526F84E
MNEPIVIVGGGAGGLELACKLGRKLGPGRVTLIDHRLFHVWKPSLHEVAAGTLDIHQEGLSYLMLAHDNGFDFVYGPMVGLDAQAQQVIVGAVTDAQGDVVVEERRIRYGDLVIAVGSTARYFGIPGASEHSLALNSPDDAERFRLALLKRMTLLDAEKAKDPAASLDIVIIGGGATGIELAAELREACRVHANYGLRHLNPDSDVRLTLLEGAPRILMPLPESLATSAADLLAQRHVRVVTDCQVARVESDVVIDAAGNRYPADLCVWAAGIQAPRFLSTLGLPVTPGEQLKVTPRLLVEGQHDIWALGDCASCPDAEGRTVPPRAQAAHQQADYLVDTFLRRERGKPEATAPFVYKDHGSLVSLGTRSTVGSLMGSLFKKSWFIEGLFARYMYASLHLMHHQAVLGTLRTAVLALARFLVKRAKPLVKLH